MAQKEIKKKEQEQTEQEEIVVYNLETKEDINNLGEKLNRDSIYFKPNNNITYKITLENAKVQEYIKTFDNETVTKWLFNIKATTKEGEEFKGFWEVGYTICKAIFKDYHRDAIFKYSKTGSGMETRHIIVKDF